jgi:ABC-2 type transport system ATP-binding protein
LSAIDTVERVELHGDALTVVAPDAPSLLSPVAVALADCGVRVRDLTMRTPTLDDVFLELTGGHLEVREVVEEGDE